MKRWRQQSDPSALARSEPVWNSDWNEETASLAYEASRETRDRLGAWADALDTKLLGVFTVGGVILTFTPSLQPHSTRPAVLGCWIGAAVAWLFALGFGFHGYRPAALRVGPDPNAFLDSAWLMKSPLHFRLWQIAEMAESFRRNHETLMLKATSLKWALGFTALEILALSAAFFCSTWGG
jgi:hypothetical protein